MRKLRPFYEDFNRPLTYVPLLPLTPAKALAFRVADRYYELARHSRSCTTCNAGPACVLGERLAKETAVAVQLEIMHERGTPWSAEAARNYIDKMWAEISPALEEES